MRPNIKLGVAYFSSPESRAAQQPLFADGLIQAIEWSVDVLNFQKPPETCQKILDSFAQSGDLIGHGVHYSVLSASRHWQRMVWLNQLSRDPLLASYSLLSVHFGFSTARGMRRGAPLPVPMHAAAIKAGHRSLDALTAINSCPIGLENLALSLTHKEVTSQGEFLEHLLSPFDGFILLDLHNLYCQSMNFGLNMMDLVRSYPLHRVMQIHISGGSWAEGNGLTTGRKIRRDTHDDAVPEAIFQQLPEVISLCPNLRYIILEQLPSALQSADSQHQYQKDFLKLHHCVAAL